MIGECSDHDMVGMHDPGTPLPAAVHDVTTINGSRCTTWRQGPWGDDVRVFAEDSFLPIRIKQPHEPIVFHAECYGPGRGNIGSPQGQAYFYESFKTEFKSPVFSWDEPAIGLGLFDGFHDSIDRLACLFCFAGVFFYHRCQRADGSGETDFLHDPL